MICIASLKTIAVWVVHNSDVVILSNHSLQLNQIALKDA